MEKKKKKFKIEIFLRNILLLAIFVYILIQTIPSLVSLAAKTTYPEEQIIFDKYSSEAIVIRNEELYKSAGKGTVEYFVEEGERIPSGKHVAKLKLSDKISTHNQKLQEINKKIDVLNEIKNGIEEDPENINSSEEGINIIVKEIQKNLQNKNYEEAEILKEKLTIFEENKDNFSGGLTQINETLQSLEVDKVMLMDEIQKNTVNYFSKDAGIVSFKVDGYEEVYKFSDRDKYKFTDLEEKPIKKNLLDNKISENNEPIFKIISNYEWYLVVNATDIKDVDKYQIGDKFRMEVKDKEIEGKIESILKEKDSITLLCKFNTNFDEFADQRFINIDVIRYKHDGLVIPKKAIVEEDNQKGVIIRDISGITRFRPIEILYEKEDLVCVNKGDVDSRIKIGADDNLVKTITRFDEILLTNISKKEGIILD